MLKWLTGIAFALSVFTAGTQVGLATVTPAAFLLCLGALVAAIGRLSKHKTLLPSTVLRVPPITIISIYMALGILSGVFAQFPGMYLKEIVQRLVIIVAPLYLCIFGARSIDDLLFAYLAYLPAGAFISLVSAGTALHLGFLKPAYFFDLHKNEIGATCATQVIICTALMSLPMSRRKRMCLSVLLGAGLLGMIGSLSRAALLSTVMAVLFMLIARRARLKYIMSFAVLVVCLLLAATWLLPKEAVEAAVSLQAHSSGATRLEVWHAVFGSVLNNPLCGVGWGNPIFVQGQAYTDVACVLLYDWMQLGLLGIFALLAMIFYCVKQPLDNARYLLPGSRSCAVNMAALGIIVARFTHAMFDAFWIGRGQALTTFIAVGTAVFIKLLIDQTSRQTGANLVTAMKKQLSPNG